MSNIPNLLEFFDGRRVESAEDWSARRKEIREYFWENVFGFPPEAPGRETFAVKEKKLFDNDILRETIELRIGDFSASFYVYKDAKLRSESRPYLIHNMHPYQKKLWNIENEIPDISDPEKSAFPIRKILDYGYNVALCDNGQFALDSAEYVGQGIFSFVENNEDNSIQVIGAWSWGISRIIDYLLAHESVKDGKIGVGGHSRGGKTALLTSMNDERVKFAWTSCSGCTGAAIARNNTGERIAQINKGFPFWFCKNYNKFNDNEDDLKLDFHALIAASAPNLVYVSSASEDAWACPENELLSAKLASEAYKLLGYEGLVADESPELNKSYHEGRIGYHIKKGGHSSNTFDWCNVLEFLKKNGW